jgi:hypothetical protein
MSDVRYYLIEDGWLESANSCVRTYVTVKPNSSSEAGFETLPAYGSAYTDNIAYSNLVVTDIARSLRSRCCWQYVVTWSTPSTSTSDKEAKDGEISDCVTSVGLSVNIRTVSSQGKWTWDSDSKKAPVDLSIPLREYTLNTSMQRYVYDTDFAAYKKICKGIVGCVNGGFFVGGEIGTVLFTGVDATEIPSDDKTKRKWKVQLNFSEKSVPWNQLWRNDIGDYDFISNASSQPMYDTADFNLLFNTLKS